MERLIHYFCAFFLALSITGLSNAYAYSQDAGMDNPALNENSAEQVKVRVFWRGFPGPKKDRPSNQEYRFPDGTGLNQVLMVITATERARGKLQSNNAIDWNRVRLGSTALQSEFDEQLNNVAEKLEKHSSNLTLKERQRREFSRLSVRLADRESMASYYLGMSYPLSDNHEITLDEENGVYVLILPHEDNKGEQQEFELHNSVASSSTEWFVDENGQIAKFDTASGELIECAQVGLSSFDSYVDKNANECSQSEEAYKVRFAGLSLGHDSDELNKLTKDILILLTHGRFYH